MMGIPSLSSLLLLLLAPCCWGVEDFYKILGVTRGASTQAIKKAYRALARETHPDKQKGKDPEIASREFRRVVDAYEVLSDEASRRVYDQTGSVPKKADEGGFGFGGHKHRGSGGPRRQHRYLWDPYLRRQIQDAQSRVLNIRSFRHLKTILLINDEETEEDDGKTERYCLLSFYDSSNADCQDRLNYELLYPWPFAGFSGEGGDGIWWEEIMISGIVDISTSGGIRIILFSFFFHFLPFL